MNENQPQAELAQVAMTVSNVDQILPFYQDILGLPLLFRSGSNLAFFSMGPVRLMLTTPQGAGAPGQNSILYFRVHDLEYTHHAMVQQGAFNQRGPQLAARMPDHELWMAFVRDPDGNLIGLIEEKYPNG